MGGTSREWHGNPYRRQQRRDERKRQLRRAGGAAGGDPRVRAPAYPNTRLVMSPIHFHHPSGTYSRVTVMKTYRPNLPTPM